MAMMEPKLAIPATANPSTLVLWLQQLEDKAELLSVIGTNGLNGLNTLSHKFTYGKGAKINKRKFVGTDINKIV